MTLAECSTDSPKNLPSLYLPIANRVHAIVKSDEGMSYFRTEVREAFARYCSSAKTQRHWFDERDEHLRRGLSKPRLRDEAKGAPEEGWVFDSGHILVDNGELLVGAWIPPAYAWTARPPVDLDLLPASLPSGDPSQRYVVLSVVHDCGLEGVEEVNPFTGGEDEHGRLWYYLLRTEAAKLGPEHEAAILDCIADVESDLLHLGATAGADPPAVQEWTTIADFARQTALSTGTISRAASDGHIKTNGKTHRDRRIDIVSAHRWFTQRIENRQAKSEG